jgi:hypothetical protein
MDYRHTEDFARQMQAAEWRAHELREEVLASFWQALVRGVARVMRRAWQRVARRHHPILPEA